MRTIQYTGCLLLLSLLAMSAQANDGEGPSNRIDFGNSYVQGQSIKSGAVYLMNRKKNEIQSMLKERESYRQDILEEYPEFRESDEPTGSKYSSPQ